MENGTHLTDAHKREVLDDVKHSLNPSNLTSDDILANRVTKVSSNVTQLAMASKTTADLAFSVNLIDYAADCVATHLESSDPNRELFHELVISDEVSMLSWCPGGYLMLHELTKACIPVRIGFEKFITMKDLEERTRERAEEAPKVRKRRGPNQMTKAPVVVPKKIMAPESTQNHKLNMERAQEVLADCTEREPVPFFRFVINPRSFVQTTYNIFITSFLVHEQHAVLSIGDDHELFIRRAPPSDDDENPLEDADNIQLIASLNALEWQQLVRRLDIREAMLPEFCPKVSQYFQDDQLCEELAEGVTFMDP